MADESGGRQASEALLTISAVVPTLNEAPFIARTVEAIGGVHGVSEVWVVDGGSSDATKDIAGRAGARVIDAPRGRGAQLAAAALRCSTDVLWFVHADTLPPACAGSLIRNALADESVAGGHFRPRFEGESGAAGFLTWLYPHLSLLGLKYGDAALFVRASAYREAGGFQAYPIFEDIDLLRRLRRRGRMVQLDAEVVTSSRRFAGRSFALTFAGWSGLQVLYWCGVSPIRLGRWYPALRAPGQAWGCRKRVR